MGINEVSIWRGRCSAIQESKKKSSHSPPVFEGPLLGLVLEADPVSNPTPPVLPPPLEEPAAAVALTPPAFVVVDAITVLGIAIPSGLDPRSTQYCTWIPLRISTSVEVFISAKVQDVDAHRCSELTRRSRLFFLHQQPELSQPFVWLDMAGEGGWRELVIGEGYGR